MCPREVITLPTKGSNTMKSIDLIAATFLFVGGVNWGLVGLFGFDFIAWLFGDMNIYSRIIYVLVGLSAIYDAAMWRAIQERWECSGFWRKAESPAA